MRLLCSKAFVALIVGFCAVIVAEAIGKKLSRERDGFEIFYHTESALLERPCRGFDCAKESEAYIDESLRTLSFWCTKQDSSSLRLFKKNREGHTVINRATSPEQLKSTEFDPKQPTFIIIHGYLSCADPNEESWQSKIKNVIAKRLAAPNIFQADWTHVSYSINYFLITRDIPRIAQEFVTIIEVIKKAFPDFSAENLHLIGHSLGAHVAGKIGSLLGGRVKQITALDPAQPGFQVISLEDKLSADDAKYVIAHHTDDHYGTTENLADRDIFFNDMQQPSCFLSPSCDHQVAYEIAGKDFGKCMMIGYVCKNWKTYRKGVCGFCRKNSNDCMPAGEPWQYDMPQNVSFVPQGYDKVKQSKNIPWIDDPSKRYHVYTPQKSSCAYTYQVVVKHNGPAPFLWHLVIKNDMREFTLRAFNYLYRDLTVIVFTSDSVQTILGADGLYYTDLLTVSPQQMNRGPEKFTVGQAYSVLGTKLDAQIWVNYMSDYDYDVRRKFSGPLMTMSSRSTTDRKLGGTKKPAVKEQLDNDIGADEEPEVMDNNHARCGSHDDMPVNHSPKARLNGPDDDDAEGVDENYEE